MYVKVLYKYFVDLEARVNGQWDESFQGEEGNLRSAWKTGELSLHSQGLLVPGHFLQS